MLYTSWRHMKCIIMWRSKRKLRLKFWISIKCCVWVLSLIPHRSFTIYERVILLNETQHQKIVSNIFIFKLVAVKFCRVMSVECKPAKRKPSHGSAPTRLYKYKNKSRITRARYVMGSHEIQTYFVHKLRVFFRLWNLFVLWNYKCSFAWISPLNYLYSKLWF